MAKREILFNDEAYSIEESVIEASLAEMKSRLVDDYSGTGTTIIYDGTAISVDSAKLAAAASNLAAMLNRFAGSGANIVVNGVTYGIDSAKLNSANTKLHVTLSDLQSGGGDSNNSIELDYFPLQAVDFEDYTSIYPFAQGFASFEPAPFMPLIGESYIINWDGTDYPCVAKECDPETTAGFSIFFGECRDIGIIGNGEPFALGFGYVEDQRFAGFVATNSFATEHTIRIYQAATKNEYGFYFNKKYSVASDPVTGEKGSYVFFEDGSAALYVYDQLAVSIPAGSFLYANHKICFMESGYESQVIGVNSNGTQMICPGSSVPFVLEGVSIDRTIPEGAYYYNFKTGATYNEMPTTLNEGDVFLCGEYCYFYGTYTDGGWWVYLATPEDCPFIQAYPNFIATDKNQTSYNPMLTSINGAIVLEFTGGIFMGCSNLENFAIPFGIRAIAGNAFGDCINLTSIVIPSSVTTIGHTAFSGCENLTNIIFEGTMAQWEEIYKEELWANGVPATYIQCSDGQVAL